jgi:hypothetical protein
MLKKLSVSARGRWDCFIAAGLAVVGLLLASQSVAHADPDLVGYLNALKNDGVEATNGGSNADLIKGGFYICKELQSGKSTYAAAQELLVLSNLGGIQQARDVVADAQTYLCPGAG